MLQAIETHGDPNVRLPEGPPFFRFSDPAESERTLRKIGFTNLLIAEVQQIWRLSSPDDLFVAFYEGTARTGGLLRAQSRVALDTPFVQLLLRQPPLMKGTRVWRFQCLRISYLSAKTVILCVSIEHQDATRDFSSPQRLKRFVDSLQRIGSRHQFIQI